MGEVSADLWLLAAIAAMSVIAAILIRLPRE